MALTLKRSIPHFFCFTSQPRCLVWILVTKHWPIEHCHSRRLSLMKMNWNKRSFLHKKSVQLSQYLFGMPIWPPLLFWSRVRPPYLRHVKRLYYQAYQAHPTRLTLPGQRDCAVTIKNAKISFFYDLYLAENQTQCPASVYSFEQAWWFRPYVTIFFFPCSDLSLEKHLIL